MKKEREEFSQYGEFFYLCGEFLYYSECALKEQSVTDCSFSFVKLNKCCNFLAQISIS